MSKSIWDDKEILEFAELLKNSKSERDADPYCEKLNKVYTKIADKFPWRNNETKEQREIRELREIVLKLVQNNTNLRRILKDFLLTVGNALRYVDYDVDIDKAFDALGKLSEKIAEVQELLKEKQE
jgi:hypothetical protein